VYKLFSLLLAKFATPEFQEPIGDVRGIGQAFSPTRLKISSTSRVLTKLFCVSTENVLRLDRTRIGYGENQRRVRPSFAKLFVAAKANRTQRSTEHRRSQKLCVVVLSAWQPQALPAGSAAKATLGNQASDPTAPPFSILRASEAGFHSARRFKPTLVTSLLLRWMRVAVSSFDKSCHNSIIWRAPTLAKQTLYGCIVFTFPSKHAGEYRKPSTSFNLQPTCTPSLAACDSLAMDVTMRISPTSEFFLDSSEGLW
jgi:hypothetical protein